MRAFIPKSGVLLCDVVCKSLRILEDLEAWNFQSRLLKLCRLYAVGAYLRWAAPDSGQQLQWDSKKNDFYYQLLRPPHGLPPPTAFNITPLYM